MPPFRTTLAALLAATALGGAAWAQQADTAADGSDAGTAPAAASSDAADAGAGPDAASETAETAGTAPSGDADGTGAPEDGSAATAADGDADPAEDGSGTAAATEEADAETTGAATGSESDAAQAGADDAAGTDGAEAEAAPAGTAAAETGTETTDTGSEDGAPVRFEARLAGHAILPAMTFVAPPANAPRAFTVSGRFAGPGNIRNEELYSVPGETWLAPAEAPRGTGVSLPFVGQPVQGFSGVKHVGGGEFLALSDNGFGSKLNSADAMLMAHRFRPDWETGRVTLLETIFLSDPNRVVPFPITTEFSYTRHLTGADFDIESIQPVGELIWFGDEFGPFLIATARLGRVVHMTGTRLGDRTLRSPDHPALRLPALPDGEVSFEVRRSRGFEGMAQSVDGTRLYPLIEGPIWDAEAGAVETHEGTPFLRLLEFDVAAREWTGNHWRYPLEDGGHAIGDFNMISETRGLVIERDGGEGVPEQACPEGEPRSDCFANPAEFKRVYLIELGEPGTAVDKIGYVDLMDIADPDGLARKGGSDGRFAFPFVTIEDVDMVDAEHIIVGNDNNLPFSTGREIGEPDDNEWILLHVGDMLK